MSGKKGMRQYPVELKLEAVRLYDQEGKMRAEITARLGIGNPYAVKQWGQLYRREGASALKKPKGDRARMKRNYLQQIIKNSKGACGLFAKMQMT